MGQAAGMEQDRLQFLQERVLPWRAVGASNCLFLAEQPEQFQQEGKGQAPAQRSPQLTAGTDDTG